MLCLEITWEQTLVQESHWIPALKSLEDTVLYSSSIATKGDQITIEPLSTAGLDLPTFNPASG